MTTAAGLDATRRHRPLRLAAVALAACLLAGCGIPLDDSPRAMSTGGAGRTAEQAPTSGGDTTAYVYFVKDDRLVDVTRDVPNRSVQEVLQALFSGPTSAESANGMISQIPAGAVVQKVAVVDGTIRVEISKAMLDVIGSANLQAVGQIVMTLTDIDPGSAVEVRVGGQTLKVSTPTRGDVSQVSECDFLSLLPTGDQLDEAGLGLDATRNLARRRTSLMGYCPDAGPTS
jgi:hypothetical protein